MAGHRAQLDHGICLTPLLPMMTNIGKISPPRSPQPHSIEAGSVSEFTLGTPRVRKCRARRGSHAGLDICEATLLRCGVEIGLLEIHLHHNSRSLSVGATLRIHYSDRGMSK